MTWFDDLYQRVADEGQRPHVLTAGDGGGRLLITEHGARVLACELPGVDHNLFFDTSVIKDMKVTGGDRLWIAPEVAFFWPTLDDARRDPKGTAQVPEAIDAGSWEIAEEAKELPPQDMFEKFGRVFAWALETKRKHELKPGQVVPSREKFDPWEDAWGVFLTNDPQLTDTRNGNPIQVNASRYIMFPEATNFDESVTSFSYLIDHFLSVFDGSRGRHKIGRCAGAWDILQVPIGGTLICPTTINVAESDRYTAGDQSHCSTPDAGPRSYYEPFGDRHVVVEDDCVRFLIDGKRRVKMGVLPEHTTGRMGYYREVGGGQSSLIFRGFAALPGEPYCDLPRNHPAHDAVVKGEDHPEMFRGDALQAYNDDGDAFKGTSFGEMEYHDPCVIAGRGPTSRTGSCVTHVMAGPDDAIKRVGRELLGVEVRGIG